MGSSPTSATNPDPIGFGVRPGGQAAKTPPFHGGNTGSIPVRVTKIPNADAFGIFLLYNNFAGMAELADAPVLGTGGQPCRFDPCYLHQKTKAKSFLLIKMNYEKQKQSGGKDEQFRLFVLLVLRKAL